MKIRVWITKYALTAGVREVEGELVGGNIRHTPPGCFSFYYHGEGKDWHRTLESAQRKAEEMRQAKIASLRKQLAKMEALKVKVHSLEEAK